MLHAGYDTVPGSEPAEVVASTDRVAARLLPVIKKSGFKGD